MYTETFKPRANIVFSNQAKYENGCVNVGEKNYFETIGFLGSRSCGVKSTS